MSFLIVGRGHSPELFAAPPMSPCTNATNWLVRSKVRFDGKSGLFMLVLSSSHFDPKRSSQVQAI